MSTVDTAAGRVQILSRGTWRGPRMANPCGLTCWRLEYAVPFFIFETPDK